MGLPEVSKVSAAQTQQVEQQTKSDLKLKKDQESKSELSQALSKGKTSKESKKTEVMQMPAKLEKKEGLSTGQKLLTGAGILGAATAALAFIKPSAAKALKGAVKLASHAPEASKGLKAGHALGAVGILAGTSMLGSCSEDFLEEEHNHFIDIPTDTITETEYVEKVIEKPVYIKDTVIQHDTIQLPPLPADTVYMPGDTVVLPGDTVYMPGDTVVLPGDTIVLPGDTVYMPGDTIFKHDTVYIDKPVPMPPETIYVNNKFESEVPEKIKEIIHDLGIDTTGVGTFVYGLDWQDEKNNVVHRTLWDGGRTSRDGDVYIMNDIGTKWSDPDEDYVFGKNEEFRRHELYLNGAEELSDCVNTPASQINVANGNGAPNWYIFDPDQVTAQPGNWIRNNPQSFTKLGDGVWQSSDGFTYERGPEPNSVRKINQHGSEWILKNISIIGGEDAKDPQ